MPRKRAGIPLDDADVKPAKKRERCKSFTTMMCLNNMLEKANVGGLAAFKPETDGMNLSAST